MKLRFLSVAAILVLTLDGIAVSCATANGSMPITIDGITVSVTKANGPIAIITPEQRRAAGIQQCISSYLIDKSLKLSAQQIENSIEEIRAIAIKFQIDQQALLRGVAKDIAKESSYHEKHRDEKKDLYARTGALILGGFGIFVTAYAAIIYFTWLRPITSEIRMIEANYNVTLARKKDPLYAQAMQAGFALAGAPQSETITYHVGVYDKTTGKYQKEVTDRLVDLKNRSEGTPHLCGIAACLGPLLNLMGAFCLYKYIAVPPRHQERYETLTKIKASLEKASQSVKNFLTVPLEKESVWFIVEQHMEDYARETEMNRKIPGIQFFYLIPHLGRKLARTIKGKPEVDGLRLNVSEEFDAASKKRIPKVWTSQ